MSEQMPFAFGIDHVCTPQPLGFGLLGDRADHVFVEIDMFDLDIGHLDAQASVC